MTRFTLIQDEAGEFSLNDNDSDLSPLKIDFTSATLQYRLEKGGKKELVLKAVGARAGLRVLDCTAGLGVDSLLMAEAGCHVTMLERSPDLHLLLRQALVGLTKDQPELASRMQLIETDAKQYLAHLDTIPDVIYIDPMFPHRKKSALVKGQMQMLQNFIGVDEDTEELLSLALASGAKKVVVKRPVTGGEDPHRIPSTVLKAKANRFDIYVGSGKAL